jgi:hypothetical protein
MTQAAFFPTVLSPILHDRRLSSVISGVAALQVLLTLLHFPGWPCPLLNAAGVPCPGCGLTRATLFLIHGDWKQSLTMHAFAPLLVLALLLITFSAIAPKALAQRMANRTETVERYSGLTTFLLVGLIVYWLARLLIFQAAFVRLIER